MFSQVIKSNPPVIEKQIYFNKVRHFLYGLNCDYPFFEEWLNKVYIKIDEGERMIITCESDDKLEIFGVCIIKNCSEEKKICTIRVAANMLGLGIGTFLMSKAIELLDDKHPLITVPEKHIKLFQSFLKSFDFKLVERVKSIYNDGCYEYFFNKPYVREDVLLSIKPIYAEKIQSGKKIVEFRRKCFGSSVKRVYVYSSSPVNRIIGYFTIFNIEKSNPDYLWEKYGYYGWITREDFNKYFDNAEVGYAIVIKKFFPFKNAPSIKDVFGDNFSVPQNYRFIYNVRAINRLNLLSQ